MFRFSPVGEESSLLAPGVWNKEQNSAVCADAVGVVDAAAGTTVHCEAAGPQTALKGLRLRVSSPSSPQGNTKLTVMEESRHRGRGFP